MFEMYLRLYEARTVSYLPLPNAGVLGREEVINAAAIATKQHPLGDRMVLAEMGDQHSLLELSRWAETALPHLGDDVIMVALGRPLPSQLEQLIKVSPRYVRASKKARELRAEVIHNHKVGNDKRVEKLESTITETLHAAHEHSKAEILRNGKCPRCHGTGRMSRKDEPCPICRGTGDIIPSSSDILKQYGVEIYSKFTRLVDMLQVDKSEWLRLFVKQITREKAA